MRGRQAVPRSGVLRDGASRLLRMRQASDCTHKKNLILRSPRSGRLEGRTEKVKWSFRRRCAVGAAQFGEGIAAGEEGFDVAGCLAQALAVFDQRDADEALAVLAEPDPRRDRDIGA